MPPWRLERPRIICSRGGMLNFLSRAKSGTERWFLHAADLVSGDHPGDKQGVLLTGPDSDQLPALATEMRNGQWATGFLAAKL